MARCTVERLMRDLGLQGVRRGRKRRTTRRDSAAVRAPDLLERNFTADRPNHEWVADIAYVPTWSGFVYVAFVVDCYSRMIVGWWLSTSLHTDLCRNAIGHRDAALDWLICHPLKLSNTRPTTSRTGHWHRFARHTLDRRFVLTSSIGASGMDILRRLVWPIIPSQFTRQRLSRYLSNASEADLSLLLGTLRLSRGLLK